MGKGAQKGEAAAPAPFLFKCACIPIPDNDGKIENYKDGKVMVICSKCHIRSHKTCNRVRSNVAVTWVCDACVVPLTRWLKPSGAAPEAAEGPEQVRGQGGTAPAVDTMLPPQPPLAVAAAPVQQQLQQEQEQPADSEATASDNEDEEEEEAAAATSKAPADAWEVFEERKGKAEDEAGLRRKTAMPAAGAVGAAREEEEEELNEYERERAARIQRNREMMASLNLPSMAQDIGTINGQRIQNFKGAAKAAAAPRRPKAAARSAPPVEPGMQRRSKRLREDPSAPAGAEGAKATQAMNEDEDDDAFRILSLDEFYEIKGIKPGPLMTGHFEGWVEEKVRLQHGIAESAAAAWEGGGGGKFQRQTKGGESAKERARKSLHKNPNEYFYRHNAPGEEQWQGEWSVEEIKNFVEVATKFSAGNKWGLFSSHIPHRVGYQCSAAYKHIMIPNGLLRDNNYKISLTGEVKWAPP